MKEIKKGSEGAKKSIIRKLISKSRGAQIYGLKVVSFYGGIPFI